MFNESDKASLKTEQESGCMSPIVENTDLVFIKKIKKNSDLNSVGASAFEETDNVSVLYVVMNEEGKMLAVTDTRENAYFFCKKNNYTYMLVV